MIVGLISCFGKGYIPKPGGDKIGRRRLDTFRRFYKPRGKATTEKITFMVLKLKTVSRNSNVAMKPQ
jgi:UDP-N-acetylglucosamine enolpyruvyl transferase